jgi:signal transduction histidine kinase
MEARVVGAFRWAALAACAVACAQADVLAPSFSRKSYALSVASLLLFGAAFWLNTRRVPGPQSTPQAVGLLLAQLPACVVVPELVFVLALEAPLVLAGEPLRYWAVLQALATVVILGVHAPFIRTEVTEYEHLSAPVAIGLHILYWLAWQAVLVPAGALAAHALRSRREIIRLNAELGATEDLLAEGARSAERVRLTHDLDDALGHHLAELIVYLELAAQRARPPAAFALRSAQGLSRRLLADVRDILGTLRPEGGGVRVDLGAALRTLLAGIGGPRLHLALPDRLEVSPLAAHVAFRCVQEAVTNSLRHAGARNVWIELRPGPTDLALDVRDDGLGAVTLREGHGLIGMRDRVEEAGGELRIETAPRKGLAVSVRLPLADPAEPAERQPRTASP